eukprot:CAMPEP_0178888084 /NCGR_PEP_ID=MMETSP0747-20121128/16979_1 /TAXON_ID=913974 /ORGANISM="Nitzschia punctata, Strain CCMP561" /LENGTH=66 /DNA_ID=CAMNT_0020557363 /DNA_START=619 /DNA_END=819 /DNA_ORIENTATION=-
MPPFMSASVTAKEPSVDRSNNSANISPGMSCTTKANRVAFKTWNKEALLDGGFQSFPYKGSLAERS